MFRHRTADRGKPASRAYSFPRSRRRGGHSTDGVAGGRYGLRLGNPESAVVRGLFARGISHALPGNLRRHVQPRHGIVAYAAVGERRTFKGSLVFHDLNEGRLHTLEPSIP